MSKGIGVRNKLCSQQSKDAIPPNMVLAHCDPLKSIVLMCDAPPGGIGAVLSHVDERAKVLSHSPVGH